MSLLPVWLIGERSEPVFAEAIAWLEGHATSKCFESPAAACENTRNANRDAIPQAMVLLQSRPGQYSSDEVEKLHAREPLARLIALTGPWCEGEQRSGRPIPGVVRVPWRNWRERLPLELGFKGDATPLPRTYSEIDRVDLMVPAPTNIPTGGGQVAVCTASLSTYCYLADVVRQLGLIPMPFGAITSAAPSPELVLFDGWEQAGAFKRQSASQNGQAPIHQILLLHFPRPEDHARVHEAGIDSVLAHPLSLADLNAALSSLPSRAA